MNVPSYIFQKIAIIAITITCHQYYFKWTIKIWKKNHQSSFNKINHWNWLFICINVFKHWKCTFYASWCRLQQIAEVCELSPSWKRIPLRPELDNVFEYLLIFYVTPLLCIWYAASSLIILLIRDWIVQDNFKRVCRLFHGLCRATSLYSTLQRYMYC